MRILAIETSCDETGLALIEASKDKVRVLANLVSSQIEIHRPYGGVFPNLAKREHLKNLPILWKQLSMSQRSFFHAKFSEGIDLIAVTYGPGLAPCLWTGVNFAVSLAQKFKKPLVAVNHLKGHIYSAFSQPISHSERPVLDRVETRSESEESHRDPSGTALRMTSIIFPFLSLIVSGGHTQLVYSKKLGHYQIIGETLDDAAGECFDKVARLLGLAYPGGPEISSLADKRQVTSDLPTGQAGKRQGIKLPRPMLNSKDYNFSFSGLKTAVLYLLRDLKAAKKNINKLKPAIAREFQDAVVEVLIKKTLAAAKEYKPKTIILGGGVAANKKLRHDFSESIKKEFPKVTCLLSPTSLTGDNALMIALAAWAEVKILKPVKNLEKLEADANLRLGN